jgi:hypothetical protein
VFYFVKQTELGLSSKGGVTEVQFYLRAVMAKKEQTVVVFDLYWLFALVTSEKSRK